MLHALTECQDSVHMAFDLLPFDNFGFRHVQSLCYSLNKKRCNFGFRVFLLILS
jgi:hypothetical protein